MDYAKQFGQQQCKLDDGVKNLKINSEEDTVAVDDSSLQQEEE